MKVKKNLPCLIKSVKSQGIFFFSFKKASCKKVDLFYIARVTPAETIIFGQWFLFFFLLFASLRSLKIVQRSMKSQRTFLDSDEWQLWFAI